MQLFEKFSLKRYNSFGIESVAKYFAILHSATEIEELMSRFQGETIFVLGGGSNVLFTNDVDGLVVYNSNNCIKQIVDNVDSMQVEVGAGVVWDDFVDWCVKRQLYGIENLSLIPGNVGAAPVQNIGAYGVEAKDVIEKVIFYDFEEKEKHEFTNAECEFGYRDSIFKNKYKGRVIIDSVVFRLSKKKIMNFSYAALSNEFENVDEVTLQQVREKVIAVRNSKLPNCKDLGNAGSFFKNPVVRQEVADKLLSEYNTVPTYRVSETETKIAAGWLIEQAGLKGIRQGFVGVHEKQALVIVNHGNAVGADVINLAKMVQDVVFEKFKIELQPEVNYV